MLVRECWITSDLIIIMDTFSLGIQEKVKPVNTESQNHKTKLLNAERHPRPTVAA